MLLQLSREQATATQDGDRPSVTDRLAWTIEHAITSVTATSFTTAAAFAANLTSSITPVRLFGLFMVVLVLVNYAFVLTLLLAILVLRERAVPAHADHTAELPAWRRLWLWSTVAASAMDVGKHNLETDTELVPLAALQRNAGFDDSAQRADGTAWDASATDGRAMPHEAQGDTAASGQSLQHDRRARHSSDGQAADADGQGLLSNSADGAGLAGVRSERSKSRRRRSRWCGCVDEHGTWLHVHAWLGGPYARAVHGARWVIMAFTALGVAFSAWRASLLTLPESRPTVWRASSNFHKYYDLVRLRSRPGSERQMQFGSANGTPS